MVSRRNFFSIIIMMAVLLFMFQFTQVLKDSGNRYDVNEFAAEEEQVPSGAYKWQPKADAETENSYEAEETTVVLSSGGYVLYVGEKENELSKIVEQWCCYTKRSLQHLNSLTDFSVTEELPEIILLDAENLELGRNCRNLKPLLNLGVPVVFCNLPATEEIEGSYVLRNVLGIEEVRSEETEVKGIRLFSGFLLGGEAVYQAQTQKEQERQDLDLTIPWFVTGSGTKTYMVGIMDEDEVEREEFPCLIWRNTYENTKVFAVCGEYMSTLTGLGILDAFTYELNSYELYPVVNAQNIVIANFPSFAAENAEEIQRLYSRKPQMVFQDIMWPSISAMTETNDLKLTCLFNTQYDYLDGEEPDSSEVIFYLQQLKELSSEAGLSLKYKDSIAFEDMLVRDEEFYDSLNSQYLYQAVFVEKKDLEKAVTAVGQEGLLENAKTFACAYDPEQPLVSYLTDEVTLQNATGNAEEHTYMDNLTVRGIQTALGYSNVLLDLQDAVWPQEVDDEWQNLYDVMSSNVHTYWSGNSGFEQTTLSESDLRVRNFLNLDYKDGRRGDTVVLKVSNVSQDAWFLLRTHGEKIKEIRGGEYEKLEADAYLIRVMEEIVEIDLEPVSLQERSGK